MSSPERQASRKQVEEVRSMLASTKSFAIDEREEAVPPDATGNRALLGQILSSTRCDAFLFSIILLNIVMVVIETDAEPGSALSEGLEWCNRICIVVYSLEMVIRLYVYRAEFFYSLANVTDLILVTSDLFLMIGHIGGLAVASLSAFRVIRIIRARKYIKTLRSHPEFREFYIIMNGFEGAMRAIAWAVLLILALLTIWSVLAVKYLHPCNVDIAENSSVYDGCDRCKRSFENVPQAILTFTQQIVAGDSWGLVSVPLIEAYPATALIFGGVLASVNLGLMNLILSVIVDKANAASEEDKSYQLLLKQAEFEEAKVGMLEMCKKMDADGGGTLTLAELQKGYETHPEFAEAMTIIDVSLDDMENLFNVMDEDQSGSVSYDEFVDQLYKMKSQDSQVMLVFIRSHVKDVRVKVQKSIELLEHQVLSALEANNQVMVEVKRILKTQAESPPGATEAKSTNSKLSESVAAMPPGALKADQEFAKLQSHLQAADDAVAKNATVLNSGSPELQSLKNMSVDLELQRLRQQAIDWEQSLARLLQNPTRQALPNSSRTPVAAAPQGRPPPELRHATGVFLPQCCSTETSKPEQVFAGHGSSLGDPNQATRRV